MKQFNKNFTNFRKNLDLTQQDKKNLTDARKLIRSTIRQAFNEMPTQYFTDDIKSILASFSASHDKKIKPKFMTQGSFAYRTINKPENPLIQQMDLDDGVYLPLSYIENEANGNFQQASGIIRKIITDCVSDLCGSTWSLEKHSKCLRIIISRTSHIDLPIYSIPDNEMTTITDNAAFSKMDELSQFLYPDKVKNVLLATDNGWIKSDPRVIHEWINETKNKYNNFIDYSRYFKAWKDHQRDDSKFSSIMIMAGIAQALSEPGYSKNDNIALDLSAIATSLKLYLNGDGIKHPTESNSSRMDEKLQNKDKVISKLGDLATKLSEATKINNVQLLIECFGGRFPNNTGVGSGIKPVVAVPITNIKNKPKPWLPS